jgi:hypothetical protein
MVDGQEIYDTPYFINVDGERYSKGSEKYNYYKNWLDERYNDPDKQPGLLLPEVSVTAPMPEKFKPVEKTHK